MIGPHFRAHGGAAQAAVLRQVGRPLQRQHHLVGKAERQAGRGIALRGQRGVEADGLLRDQIGRHGDNRLGGRERAERGLDPQPLSRVIDQRHLAIQRQRQRGAIGRHQRAVAAPHPPIDVGVLIGLHVQDRDLVELAAVHIGRNRIDHRIPAIAGLEIVARRAVAAASGGFRGAIIEHVERADEFVALLLRERLADRPLAPGRQRPVDLEIQLVGDGDKGILVSRMQPATAEIEGDLGRGHDGVAASADPVARLQHDGRKRRGAQRMCGAETGRARADNGDID